LVLPLLTFIGTQIYIWNAERGAALAREQARRDWQIEEQARLKNAHRDFVCIPEELPRGRRESFLIVDTTVNTLARIDVEKGGGFENYAVGTINGK
jgi:hypothetical protein